ncbi:FtsX-like permease family protein [Lentilactobacillus diolivorans]|nr:ABC transporter permease [Lentilactobacillus diolivorans]GEP24202.1 ABC transporter permease [Lentilactobacillus diolivorans]
MLFKISISGIKARWRDYIVLFSGMIMASAIFYMFEAIALNKKFVTSTTVGQSAKVVFSLGSILLIIITLVYILYANNFLMSMRKHDYGLFMMLGAKSSKIGTLINLETLTVGLFSTLIGVVAGIGLTKVISNMLVTALDIPVKYFQAVYNPAIWSTLILFMILFIVAGLMNARSFTKTAALKLLNSESKTDWKQPRTKRLIGQAALGVIFLAMGYYSLDHIQQLKGLSILIGLVTIVCGTYFIFNSFFVILLERLQQSVLNKRGINSFTIAQLKFRIHDYTKILSIVSLLFSLALGAITVGIGLQNGLPETANAKSAYVIATTNPSSKMAELIAKTHGKNENNYQQKVTKKAVYYRLSEFSRQPIEYPTFVSNGNPQGNLQIKKSRLGQLGNSHSQPYQQLRTLQNVNLKTHQIKFVSDQVFSKVSGEINHLKLIRVKDLNGQSASLKAIFDLQKRELGSKVVQSMGESLILYEFVKNIFSSMEFMGVFLGIAFLAMLASCLMFKILSGIDRDKTRFEMLNKIGTSQRSLKRSIMLQIMGLFGLPAALGLINVGFGLQMFVKASLLHHAYQAFAYSSIGFLALYLVYYVITVLIYQKVVVPKAQNER